MRWFATAVVCVLASSASADPKSDALAHELLSIMDESTKVHVAVVDADTKVDEASPLRGDPYLIWDPVQPLYAFSADGAVGWFTANLYQGATCDTPCPELIRNAKRDAATKPEYRITALVDGDRVVFVHYGQTGDGVGHATIPLDEEIADDAKPVVALFEKTIANPKAFAATVSPRKDALLLGSQPAERFVGGATVRATLAKWGLSLTTVGGIVAGVAKSKTVAWVITDVDAVGAKGGKPAPYRMTVVYEKTGGTWQIVQLHFT